MREAPEVSHLLLPWERLLWSQRARSLRRTFHVLTDFRLLRISPDDCAEVALHDIQDVRRVESSSDRLLGTSTVIIRTRTGTSLLALERVVGGTQLAGLLEWISSEPESVHDADLVQAALAWRPQGPGLSVRGPLSGLAVIVTLLVGLAIGLHGRQAPVQYAPSETIYPGGHKRSSAEIAQFMETDVLPWARVALGPVVGGPERVSCATCHGTDAPRRAWQMPSVARLPEPVLAFRGWEQYSRGMDPQTRNAVYGYLAESDKQATATYMREVVMPGMARLLGRPPYDFTKGYDHNRTQHAFGCYHCHAIAS